MLLSIVFIFAIINTIGWTDSQPIIPSYAPRYQLVYLTPPFQIHQYPPSVQLPTQPIINNRVLNGGSASESVEDSLESNGEEEEKYEVSQFHSEDADGRIVFGFHSPDQIRMEARDIDGSVRGSYSYIDPNGHVVKMQYWDDGSGFHAAGNNIPVAVHQLPEDTPDVKAARENHLRLYDAALQILKAINEQDDKEDKDDGSYIDTSNYEGDEYEEDEAPPEGGVIIENPAPPSSIYADSILSAEYPGKVEFSQTNQLSDNSQYNDEDKESVSIENPEFRNKKGIWHRKGKSQPEQEETDGGQSDRISGELVVENHPAGSDQAPALSRMDQPPPPLSVQTADGPASSVVVNNDQQHSAGGNRAFFYHFTHTIPMPVERVENIEETRVAAAAAAAAAGVPEQSFSVKAQQQQQQLGSIPVAAVHDAQVSPLQRELLPNFQLYQVYHPQID